MRKIAALVCAGACAIAAADYPSADITNGAIRAKLYLPDPENGYYRATRFDWSGVIGSLEYRAHNYFAPWLDTHDPTDHEAISGPVEEFLTGDAGLGWAEAKPGGTFVKIGVGIIRKPEATKFEFWKTYEIVEPGKWTVRKSPDQVEFTQVVNDGASGYGYEYRKTVRLARDKPDLVLEHSLKNTGSKPIDTKVYDHNFFVIDGQPSGPDFLVRFPFRLWPRGDDLKDLVQLRGNELDYVRELKKGESAYTHLDGFGDTPKDYNIRVENVKMGAGVRITADKPLADLVFWTVRTTLCPEAFLSMHIDPGGESKWTITYHFYTMPPVARE